jgi:predicted dinucleotide-binding enzyme
MQKFLGLQKKIFLGLSEEMKSKIVLSVQNTSKIISDSNKDLILANKKQVAEIEQVSAEREKVVKR